MVVKSSIFGFRDALEEESDRYAMAFIQQKQGSTEAYRRVMQRCMTRPCWMRRSSPSFMPMKIACRTG